MARGTRSNVFSPISIFKSIAGMIFSFLSSARFLHFSSSVFRSSLEGYLLLLRLLGVSHLQINFIEGVLFYRDRHRTSSSSLRSSNNFHFQKYPRVGLFISHLRWISTFLFDVVFSSLDGYLILLRWKRSSHL